MRNLKEKKNKRLTPLWTSFDLEEKEVTNKSEFNLLKICRVKQNEF
jgi:hypothetical protein